PPPRRARPARGQEQGQGTHRGPARAVLHPRPRQGAPRPRPRQEGVRQAPRAARAAGQARGPAGDEPARQPMSVARRAASLLLLALLCVAALTLLVASPARADDSVGHISRLDVGAVVEADGGTVRVEVDLTYDFGDDEA